MADKIISDQLTRLVEAIIADGGYPDKRPLSLPERRALIAQLKSTGRAASKQDSTALDETMLITNALYRDKVSRELRLIDTNFAWIFEILQHELVSATRLHALLLDLAREEHFSAQGIAKIDHYFAETNDHGDNDNFITMSASDVIDSLSKAGTFRVNRNITESSVRNKTPHVVKKPQAEQSSTPPNNIIKLKDY